MTLYKCDICGKNLKKEELRYRIKIEACAVYEQNEIHIADLIRNHQEEIIQLIKKMEEMSAEELEEQIYKKFEFDLCPNCHRAYLKNPLFFQEKRYSENEPDNLDKEVEKFLSTLLSNKKEAK